VNIFRLRVVPLLLIPCVSVAQDRAPIIDMHLHARKANYIGPNPPPMCAPFTIMPRSDNKESVEAGFTFNAMPPCEKPILPVTTDEQAISETVAIMKRRNIIGMVSGEPELMSKWRAAAPDRIIPGLDLRLGANRGASHVKSRTPADLRILHR